MEVLLVWIRFVELFLAPQFAIITLASSYSIIFFLVVTLISLFSFSTAWSGIALPTQ